MDPIGALERCAYCREYVPVTRLTIEAEDERGISATVAVCENCFEDGR